MKFGTPRFLRSLMPKLEMQKYRKILKASFDPDFHLHYIILRNLVHIFTPTENRGTSVVNTISYDHGLYSFDKMLRILCVLVSAGIPSIHEPRDHGIIRPGTSQLLTEIGKYFKDYNYKAEFFLFSIIWEIIISMLVICRSSHRTFCRHMLKAQR